MQALIDNKKKLLDTQTILSARLFGYTEKEKPHAHTHMLKKVPEERWGQLQ